MLRACRIDINVVGVSGTASFRLNRAILSFRVQGIRDAISMIGMGGKRTIYQFAK
jgi:hypothetical protein